MNLRSLARALLALVVAAACSAAPVTPPSPSAGDASPTRPPATPTPAAPTQAASPTVDHPTGATDVVLRAHRTGGFLWPGATVDQVPMFTLYGDGTVIYTEDEALGGSDPRRGLRLARMNEDQASALLAFALGPGGLAEAAERYNDIGVADATTVEFSIDAAGVDKTVFVYALDDGLDEPGPETAHRQRFLRLFEVLQSFSDEVARGNATDLGEYEAEAYRVVLYPDEAGEVQVTGEWPWDDLEPTDLEADPSGFLGGTLTPEQAAALAQVGVGDMGDPVVVGPDGGAYLIRYRPLLPDELP